MPSIGTRSCPMSPCSQVPAGRWRLAAPDSPPGGLPAGDVPHGMTCFLHSPGSGSMPVRGVDHRPSPQMPVGPGRNPCLRNRFPAAQSWQIANGPEPSAGPAWPPRGWGSCPGGLDRNLPSSGFGSLGTMGPAGLCARCRSFTCIAGATITGRAVASSRTDAPGPSSVTVLWTGSSRYIEKVARLRLVAPLKTVLATVSRPGAPATGPTILASAAGSSERPHSHSEALRPACLDLGRDTPATVRSMNRAGLGPFLKLNGAFLAGLVLVIQSHSPAGASGVGSPLLGFLNDQTIPPGPFNSASTSVPGFTGS